MIGIDSNVLIYAGIVPSNGVARGPAFDDLRVRSILLLNRLLQDKTRIILSTISISELMVPVPENQKGTLAAKFTKYFICAPFDIRSAAIASELWARHKKLPPDLQYENRHTMKADVMILASAKSAGATAFYTHDKKCRDLAGHILKACDLPTRDPNDMFAINDIRNGSLSLDRE